MGLRIDRVEASVPTCRAPAPGAAATGDPVGAIHPTHRCSRCLAGVPGGAAPSGEAGDAG